MGRKTYEVAIRSGQGGGGYPGVQTYVFSRKLKEAPTEASRSFRRTLPSLFGN
jgi:dihydrofolate reductase